MNSIFVAEPDPERFRERVSPRLAQDPVGRTAPITVLHGVIHGQYDQWRLAAVESSDGRVTGCAVQTPPYKVIVAIEGEGAAAALAHGLRESEADLPGVV